MTPGQGQTCRKWIAPTSLNKSEHTLEGLFGKGVTTTHQPRKAMTLTTVNQLSPRDIGIIKLRLKRGDLQHRIAADFDINAGRISEINTGKRFPNVPPAAEENRDV